MANSYNNMEYKASEVLKLCGAHDCKRYLWRHALRTQRENIESALSYFKISLSNDLVTGDIMFVSPQVDTVHISNVFDKTCESLSAVRHRLKNNLLSNEMSVLIQQFSDNELSIFEDENKDGIWVVGLQHSIIDVIQRLDVRVEELLLPPKSTNENRKSKRSSFEGSFENLRDPIYVKLSQEEEAMVWLYDMFKLDCLKPTNVHVDKDRFHVKISVTDTGTKDIIEKAIRDQISLMKCTVGFKKRSFSSGVFEFLIRKEVHDFLKANIKKAVWFEDSPYRITVYCRNYTEAEKNLESITKAFMEESFPVPQGYFKTEKAKEELIILEKKYSRKAVIKLSENGSTVNLLYTSDIYDIKTQIKGLFAVRTITSTNLRTRAMYKICFERQKRYLEEKFYVNIIEEEFKTSYGWIIKGEKKDVQLAYDEIFKLIYNVKTFMIDKSFAAVEATVKQLGEKCKCSIAVSDQVKTAATNFEQKQTDLRDHIPCRIWNASDGSVLTLYQCNMHQHPWMFKDCIVVEVHQSIQPVKKTELKKGEYFMIASVFLPVWKDGGHKEKEQLEDELACLMKKAKSCRETSFTCLSFNLADANKLNWRRNKYLKRILCTIGLCQPSMPVRLHEPSSEEFKNDVDIIDTWCIGTYKAETIRKRIQITVVTGELVQQKCDVIVNSTSSNLDLKQGAVSRSILKHAGQLIQSDCTNWLQNRPKIEFADVCITRGYALGCNYVYHGTLPTWSSGKHEMLDMFVETCLANADAKHLKSIAFPALGTGNLGYPSNIVAAKMFDTVEKYLTKNPIGTLEDVRFVIYQMDHETIKVFKSVEKSRQENDLIPRSGVDTSVTCPDIVTFSVGVVGNNNNDVQNAFKEIEDNLRKTKFDQIKPDDLSQTTEIENTFTAEPADQNIDRLDKNVREDDNLMQDDKSKRKDETDKWTSKDAKTEGSTSMCKSNITEDEYRVEVRIIDDTKILDPGKYLFCILGQCNVQRKEIVWNPSFPLQARVRRKNETEAEKLISFLNKKNIFEAKKCYPEAVVNIRATLNSGMNTFLEDEKFQELLSSMSGVKLQKDTKTNSFILFGDLTEIGRARELLLHWKTQRKQEKYNLNEIEPLSETGQSHENVISEEQAIMDRNNSETSRNVLDSDSNSEWKRTVSKSDGVLKVKLESGHESVSYNKHTNFTDSSCTEGRKNDIYTPINTAAGSDQAARLTDTDTTENNRNKIYPNLQGESLGNKATNLNSEGLKSSKLDVQYRKGLEIGSSETHLYPRQQEKEQYGKVEGAVSKGTQDFPVLSDDSLMITTKEGIKVYVYQANLCYLKVDCIVNSSNSQMVHRHGLSKVISTNAGKSVEDECKKYIEIHRSLKDGDVMSTNVGNLWHYQSILHVNAPRWNSSLTDEEFFYPLSEAVVACLHEANKSKMNSVAIPALSSGGEGIPKALCYSAYPEGVINFSGQVGKKTMIKEIHFVDIDQNVVQLIQGAFIETITETDVAKKGKKKILPYIKELFAKRKPAGNYIEYRNLPNKVFGLICSGTLLKALKHQHVKDLSFKNWSYEETALVVPESVSFDGKYVIEILKRGLKEFQQMHTRNAGMKKNPGDVLHSSGDKQLGFGHIFVPIMPQLSKLAREKDSKQQRFFFDTLKKCCRNVLEMGNKKSVKHLAIAVLGPEFYDYKEKWFLERCVGNMKCEILDFAQNRHLKTNDYMIVHIVTNGNDEMLKMFETNLKPIIRESAL